MVKMTREEFWKEFEERMKMRKAEFAEMEKEPPKYIITGKPMSEEYLLKKGIKFTPRSETQQEE